MGVKLIDPIKRRYRIAFWYQNRHYVKIVRGNRKLADDVESQMRLQLAERRYFPERSRPNPPFEEAAHQFLREFSGQKPSARYHWYNMAPAIEFFGGKGIHDITPEDVRRYRAGQKAAGTHPVTLNHRQKVIRRMFNWLAQRNVFQGENPASGRKVPLENERPYWRRRFLSPEEFQRLFFLAAPRLRTIIITAAHTGMRYSELRAMRKRDVDLVQGTISIPISKNGDPGSVPLTETLRRILTPILESRPSPDSKVLNFENFERLWTAARRSAGLIDRNWKEGMTRWEKAKANRNFHFHDLRHTAASYAIMGSKNPYAVQHFLRLRTQALMQRYAHLLPGYVREVALTLDTELPIPGAEIPSAPTLEAEVQPIKRIEEPPRIEIGV